LFNLANQETAFRYNENLMITPYFRHHLAQMRSGTSSEKDLLV
jgi:hypothetical protein